MILETDPCWAEKPEEMNILSLTDGKWLKMGLLWAMWFDVVTLHFSDYSLTLQTVLFKGQDQILGY